MSDSKEFLTLLSVMFLLILSIFLIDSHLETVMSENVSSKDGAFTVVIDAGHGGFDSGKVGVDGTLEKDVNLIIAKRLEKLLTAADVNVIMTRTEDVGLYDEASSNKKRQDMTARAALMNRADADCIISIHQNSYTEESIDGAQVFYYSESEEGKRMAVMMQKALTEIDNENTRKEKANDNYYLLKRTKEPTIIVECGFLSNPKEAAKLVEEEYQDMISNAIVKGIESCFGN